ncbi:MAG TPA: tRNA epoxyqueuosine(34) reductase QueG [Gemmatimonadaceae bacterium]|nr:tRNA epoxyqueuosine(34) reductase QueG [Gemmatimonadaceae bacterium]
MRGKDGEKVESERDDVVGGGPPEVGSQAPGAASAPSPPIPAPHASLAPLIKAQAYGLGFDLAGIAALGPAETAPYFDEWLARGYAGEMHYLPKWAEKRRDFRLPFPGVTSAVVAAMSYGGREPGGPVARYARGDDYHDVMVERLRELHRWIEERVGRPVRGKAYVDTGPLLERDLGRRAGLGWFGKNTNLINPKLGSFFFLGSLVLDLELEPDAPFEADRCGSCTRCLDACPTNAFVEPRVLDATRCISYLTIEQRGAIPEELRAAVGEWIYGCDICQTCCPWNVRFAQELKEPAFAPREGLAGKDARTLARELLEMTQEEFSRAFKGSPMKRAKLRGLKRNAAVVLGNVGDPEDADVLTRALEDPEPLVREHAAWALARLEARDGSA